VSIALRIANLAGNQSAEGSDQQVIEDMDDALRSYRQAMGEHGQREVAALCNSNCGADQGEPGQRGLAHLFNPEEIDRVDVEPVGDRQHDIAHEYAIQHGADGQQDETANDDLRNREDGLHRPRAAS
jgi:hypothetical protein